MLQRSSIHNPTHVACHVIDYTGVSISDGDYAGVTIHFTDEAGLRAFVLTLIRALAEPGVMMRIEPDPARDFATDLVIDRALEEA